MDNQIKNSLEELDVSPEQFIKIEKYVHYLTQFDRSKRLTSFNNSRDWFINHVEDCIKTFDFFKDTESLYDLGSGNGLPGLIFSILGPDKTIFLVDNDKKKGEFLKTMIFRLKLNARVMVESINEINLDNVPRGTEFLYRAFSPKDVALKFIKNNSSFEHFYFASEEQKLHCDVKKELTYTLSNGIQRKILKI